MDGEAALETETRFCGLHGKCSSILQRTGRGAGYPLQLRILLVNHQLNCEEESRGAIRKVGGKAGTLKFPDFGRRKRPFSPHYKLIACQPFSLSTFTVQ